MTWKFWTWFRKRSYHPQVVIQYMEDGRVHVSCDWPQTFTTTDQAQVGQQLANMIYYLNSGQLLPLIQQAVADAGTLKEQPRFSEYVLSLLNRIFSQSSRRGGGGSPEDGEGGYWGDEDDDGDDDDPVGEPPVIPPDQVFARG